MKRLKTGGRKKNSPNILTKEIKANIQTILSENSDNAKIWLEELATQDKYKALQIYCSLAKMIVPTNVNLSDEDGNQTYLVGFGVEPKRNLL